MTVRFFLLCGGTVLFMASFGMLLPELPAHLAQMGGEQYLGGVVGMFYAGGFFVALLERGRIARQSRPEEGHAHRISGDGSGGLRVHCGDQHCRVYGLALLPWTVNRVQAHRNKRHADRPHPQKQKGRGIGLPRGGWQCGDGIWSGIGKLAHCKNGALNGCLWLRPYWGWQACCSPCL